MIYKVLKVLIKLTMFFFFKKRIVRGAENIPASGPTILVANHPVTFLDPLLVAVATKRQVHFLAKGAMFKNGLIRAIFKSFNMIPIYRAQDNPSDMSKNQDTFHFCYEHLEKGGLILIFPEGISVTDRTLKPLKTGVARIALGAEAKNKFKLGVKIIPIGLTYEGPHEFRKDVLINIGESIILDQNRLIYEKDDREAVRVLTNQIAQDVGALSLNLESDDETKAADFLLTENALKNHPFDTSVGDLKSLFATLRSQESSSQEVLEKVNEIVRKKEEMGLNNLSIEEGYSLVK